MQKHKSGKKYFFFGVLTTVLLIAGIAAFGFMTQMNHFKQHGPWGLMIDKLTKDINLNADQKTQMDNLKAEIKAKMESRKQEKQNKPNAFDDFSKAFLQDHLDKQTLLDLQSKRDADRQEMREFFTGEIVKFHDILTPDQRQQVIDKMKTFKDKHKMNWGKKNKPENN